MAHLSSIGTFLIPTLVLGLAAPPPRETPPQESEKEKVARREEAKLKEYEGVPWAEARTLKSDRFALKTNCSEEVGRRYLALLEACRDAHLDLFKDHPVANRGRSQVHLFRNREDMVDDTKMPGIASFYSPMGRLGIPPGAVVTYYGAGESTGDGWAPLLFGATMQFENLVVDNLWNAGTWLSYGLAVFFESSRIEKGKVIYREPGSKEVGIVPRERLKALQSGLKTGNYVSLKRLTRTPQSHFSRYHEAHGWALVHCLLNADDRKQRAVLDEVWRTARERAVAPEEFEEIMKEATGLELEEFEEKVWKPYVLGLALPPTGVIKGRTFTSARMKLQVTLAGEGWSWDLQDLPDHIQARMKRTRDNASIDLAAWRNTHSAEDLKEKGLGGLFQVRVEETVQRILTVTDYEVDFAEEVDEGEEPEYKPEELSLYGYRAMRFIYPAEDPNGPDEEATLTKFLVIIPTVERHYEIRGQCPTKEVEKFQPDFDAVVRSFRILD